MQPPRGRTVRRRRRWNPLLVSLAWSLSLPLASAAFAEPSGSPSRILEKGRWVFGLGGSGLWKRAMKGGAKLSVAEGSLTRGYGLTDRVSLYGRIGGASVGNDDPSISTNVNNGFGANLVLGGQLNANLWKTKSGWEWDGSAGYLYMGSPHKRKGNQVNWSEWQLATSIAKSLGSVTPYAGIKLSLPHIVYQLRTDKVTTHGSYQPKGIVGPLLGFDWSFGEDQTAVLNLEGSYVGGAEVDLTLTKRFLGVPWPWVAEPAEQPPIETPATGQRVPESASAGASPTGASIEGVIMALELNLNLVQTSSMTLGLADGTRVRLTMTSHATTVTQQGRVLSLEQLTAGDRVLVRYRRKDRPPRARTIEILERVKDQDAPMHYPPPTPEQPTGLSHHGGHKKE